MTSQCSTTCPFSTRSTATPTYLRRFEPNPIQYLACHQVRREAGCDWGVNQKLEHCPHAQTALLKDQR